MSTLPSLWSGRSEFSVLQTCRQVDLAEHLNHACFFAKTRQVFKTDLLDGTSLEGFNVPGPSFREAERNLLDDQNGISCLGSRNG